MGIHKVTGTLERKLGSMFRWMEKHFWLTVVLLFVLALGVRLALTPYNTVSSNYTYLHITTALGMTAGDFSPMRDHTGFGWNVILAPFLLLFGGSSGMRYMNIARTLSVLFGALLVFPTALIGKEVFSKNALGKKSILFALVLVAFDSHLVLTSSAAVPDPLFAFLVLFSIWFVFKAVDNPNYLLIAGAVGGLSYSTHATGLFVLPVILVSFFLLRKKVLGFSYRHLVYCAIFFFLVISPLMYQRYASFGSPFYSGDAGKFWLEDFGESYTNVPAPTFFEYLKTHSLTDHFNRFIIGGFFKVLGYFGYFLLSPLIVLFFVYGIIRFGCSKKFIPLTTALVIWLLAFMPMFYHWAVASPKYFIPLLPLILLLSSAALSDIFRRHQHRNLLLALFLLIFSLYSLAVPAAIRLGSVYAFDTPVGMWYRFSHGGDQGGSGWGRWVAENVQGRVVLFQGSQLIMMHLPDTMTGADDATRYGIEHGGSDFYAPVSNLSVITHGVFDTFDEAMEWYRDLNVTHIVVDESLYKLKRLYLQDIWEGRDVPPYLEEVYSTYGTGSEWEVRIYAINWTKYHEGQEAT